MLSALAETDWLDYLHDALIRALPELGAPVLEPALHAHASSQDQDFRHGVAAVLPGIGVRDERVFSILLDDLREDPTGGAGPLADYGDARAVEHLVRAFDEHEVVADGSPFADQALVELREAIERLGGALNPAQEAQYNRALQPRERWRRRLAAALETASVERASSARKVGRNDPCPCSSGKKFKKCCRGKPELR